MKEKETGSIGQEIIEMKVGIMRDGTEITSVIEGTEDDGFQTKLFPVPKKTWVWKQYQTKLLLHDFIVIKYPFTFDKEFFWYLKMVTQRDYSFRLSVAWNLPHCRKVFQIHDWHMQKKLSLNILYLFITCKLWNFIYVLYYAINRFFNWWPTQDDGRTWEKFEKSRARGEWFTTFLLFSQHHAKPIG